MHPNVAGALVNSAIYLLCVFVAGIVTGHPMAWKQALAAMGITYASHVAQLIPGFSRDVSIGLVLASIVVGMVAGLNLLF